MNERLKNTLAIAALTVFSSCTPSNPNASKPKIEKIPTPQTSTLTPTAGLTEKPSTNQTPHAEAKSTPQIHPTTPLFANSNK